MNIISHLNGYSRRLGLLPLDTMFSIHSSRLSLSLSLSLSLFLSHLIVCGRFHWSTDRGRHRLRAFYNVNLHDVDSRCHCSHINNKYAAKHPAQESRQVSDRVPGVTRISTWPTFKGRMIYFICHNYFAILLATRLTSVCAVVARSRLVYAIITE